MKLIFQADDFGISRGVTEGILYGIEHGIIRNTGMFVNMPHSEWAAKKIKKYTDISVGIDINLVTGCPVSNVNDIKSLVDNDGVMLRSSERAKRGVIKNKKAGRMIEYEIDPFDFTDALLETENQVKKFLELMDRKPDYIHGHALLTPNSRRAIKIVAEKYGIPITEDVMHREDVSMPETPWLYSGMTLDNQFTMNLETELLNILKSNLHKDMVYYICHCGFVDQELLDLSSFTLIRSKDLASAVSLKVQEFIKENKIELINYSYFREENPC